jgi:hypothetical protein
MLIWVPVPDICWVSDLTDTDTEIIFLLMSDTRTRSELRWVWDGYFFPPANNPTGTRYFTTDIILRCEQVKMCLFYYINYDLF